jgi:integrase
MASIHKDPRGKSPFWYAAYYGGDGSRKFKSTKTSNRKEALKICVEWSDASEKARARTLTTAQVRKVFNEILDDAGDDALENFTVAQWMREWIAGKTSSRGSKTGERYQKPIEDFIEHMGTRAALPLRAVTSKDVRSFRDAQVKLGKSPVTVNLAHKVVASALAAAKRQGYIGANPASGVDYLPTHSDKSHKETFSAEEIGRIYAAAAGDWKGVVLLGAFAGMRLGDALRLRWSDVDLQAGSITYIPSKTARLEKVLTVPIHPELEAFLLKHPAGKRDTDPLFPSLAKLSISGRSGASGAFKRIMERAGVAAGIARQKTGKEGRSVSARSFHSLRHGFVTSLAGTGAAIEVRRQLVGHTSDKQSLDYTHPEFERMKDAVTKIPWLKSTEQSG